MIVISAGNKYLDIDAYASGIAYAVLLQSLGEEVVFASSAKENMSICPLIKELGFNVDREYEPKEDDKFIVLDLSNPEFFDTIINSDNIIEVIDHHTGFEEYWKIVKLNLLVQLQQLFLKDLKKQINSIC